MSVLLRPTLFLVLAASAAAQQVQRVNLAKYQTCAASSAAAGDPALYATDGIAGNGSRWKSDGAGPHWLTVTLPLAMELGSAQLFLGRDDIEPVTSFSLQWWNGSAWIDIPGTTVTANTFNEFNFVFAVPVTTSRIRIYTTEAVARVREIALFAPNGVNGYPLGTDVTLNLAKKRKVTASSVDGSDYAKGAVDGYADNAGRWKSGTGNGPHTLEVDLEVASRLGSAHLYTGAGTSPPIAAGTLEYWNGNAWAAIPGGSFTGNTANALRMIFTAPVSTSRVRLNIPGNGAQRVNELLVFAANGTDGYPLGTDVIVAPPPVTYFDRLGDGYWKIINKAYPNSLIADAAGASQTQPDSTEEAKHWQLIYNLESDTYRFRNRDSQLCIVAQDAGKAPGTDIVESANYQGMPHELWRWQDMGSANGYNYFRLINHWSGLAVQTDGGTPARVTLQPPSASDNQLWRREYITHYPKKGTGGYESEWARYNASWNYNWGRDTGANLPAQVTFSPMQHNRWWPGWAELPEYYTPWHTTSKVIYHLGFNEPDHTDQANMTVDEAISQWPFLESSDVPLVSPVPASAFGGWLGDFYNKANARGYRVDFTAVHWYGNPNASSLINHLQSVFNTWGKPVWLTEFSTVDWGGNATWTEEDNYKFISEFMWRAEDYIWLKRYAIFIFTGDPPANPWDRTGPRSDVRRNDGSFTAFGEFYATWDGDLTIHPRTAYMIHNHGAVHRLRASSTSNDPSTGSIHRSDVSTQFAFVPSPTSGRSYIVSLRDGRRLRYENSDLDLAPPGTTGASLEWRTVADWEGTYFLENTGSSRRLRMNRSPDNSSAPTSLGYGTEATTAASDNLRWRIIRPAIPEPVTPPAAPATLTATAGENKITLSWPAVPDADFLGYSVYRATASGGPWQRIATALTTPGYVDLAAANNTTWHYAVTAYDWIEAESPYSPAASATPGAYSAWVATAFAANPGADTAFGADPDGDDLPNGLEYAFLTDPLKSTVQPFTAIPDATGGIAFTFPFNPAATDLVVTLLASPDMTAWQSVAYSTVSQIPDGPVVRVTIRPAASGAARQYFRLKLTLP